MGSAGSVRDGTYPAGTYKSTCDCRPRQVEVVCYHHNHSAFNGYRRTWSAWSMVRCRTCGRPWRTKARYVDTAPMAADACRR